MEVKIVPNVLTPEECAEIIASAEGKYVRDFLKKDMVQQSKYSDKETLDANTETRTVRFSGRKRKLCYAIIDPVFDEWDGKPVYSCRVIRYQVGDFAGPHRDSQWMCLSNYWAPGTNLAAHSVMSCALNDDYEGGEFVADYVTYPQEVGSVIQIPQNPLDKEKSMGHSVTEVTRGTRYALVFWNFA